MNRMIKLTLATVLASTLTPAQAARVTEGDAVAACAEAIVTQLGDVQAGNPAFVLDEQLSESRERVASRALFHLDAIEPQSREVVARVDCIVDSRGRVRKLDSLSLEAPAATDRARTRL